MNFANFRRIKCIFMQPITRKGASFADFQQSNRIYIAKKYIHIAKKKSHVFKKYQLFLKNVLWQPIMEIKIRIADLAHT